MPSVAACLQSSRDHCRSVMISRIAALECEYVRSQVNIPPVSTLVQLAQGRARCYARASVRRVQRFSAKASCSDHRTRSTGGRTTVSYPPVRKGMCLLFPEVPRGLLERKIRMAICSSRPQEDQVYSSDEGKKQPDNPTGTKFQHACIW